MALSVWCLTEGHAGMESQALGLGEALCPAPVPKRVRLPFPWTHVPPALALPPLDAGRPGSDSLAPPWPDVLVSCGRRSVGLALAVRRASGGRTFAVHIQDPQVDPARFDLVAPPAHDGLSGPNVVPTRTAIHRVTRARLDAAAAEFAPGLAHLPRPLVAVLVGGSNRRQALTPELVGRLCDGLAGLASGGAGLAVTPSRRTGDENVRVLRERLAGLPVQVWDFAGANPYFGFLGLADAVVATSDSVSMTSEALATGKPVYVFEVPGASRRLAAFQRALAEAGFTRPLAGRLENWGYEAPDETRRVADEVRRRLAARGCRAL